MWTDNVSRAVLPVHLIVLDETARTSKCYFRLLVRTWPLHERSGWETKLSCRTCAMRSYWRAFSFPRQGRSGSLHSARHKRSVREFIGGIPFVQPCSLVAAAQTHASRPCGRLHYMFHSIIESELQFSHTGTDVSRSKQSISNFSFL